MIAYMEWVASPMLMVAATMMVSGGMGGSMVRDCSSMRMEMFIRASGGMIPDMGGGCSCSLMGSCMMVNGGMDARIIVSYVIHGDTLLLVLLLLVLMMLLLLLLPSQV